MWKVTRRDSDCIKGCREIENKLNDGREVSREARTLVNAFGWLTQPEGSIYWAKADKRFKIKWVKE